MNWSEERQEQLCAALQSDAANANLDDADKSILVYTIKLTLSPQDMNLSDIEALRSVGFDDLAIHDICCIASHFAFVNRMADGLGVSLETQ